MAGFPLNFDTLFMLLFVIGATVYVLRFVWDLLTSLESRSWHTTQGRVVGSTLEESRRRMFRARVSYRFMVDGREFAGERACFGDSDTMSWSWLARRIVARYRFGDAVTVHYDPAKPSEAVLEPGISGALVIRLVIGIVFLAAAIWMLRQAVHA